MSKIVDAFVRRIARFLEPALNDMRFMISCDYQIRYPLDPIFYPVEPSTVDTVITGHTDPDTWSADQTLIPAAIIDAEGKPAFTILGMRFRKIIKTEVDLNEIRRCV